MRLQVLALVLAVASATLAHPSTSKPHPRDSWQRQRREGSPNFTPPDSDSDSPRAETTTEAARRGARGHLRAVDSVDVIVQHWPPLDEAQTESPEDAWTESYEALVEKPRYRENRRYSAEEPRRDDHRYSKKTKDRQFSSDLRSKEQRYRDETTSRPFTVDKSIKNNPKSDQLGIVTTWGGSSQPKPRQEKRYWTKPIRVEETTDLPATTQSAINDWSGRVGGETPPKKTPGKGADDRTDWSNPGRQPTAAELAELSNLATRLTQQLEKEHQQHIMSMEQRATIQQQEMQQTLQEVRQQQVLQQNLQLQSMQQKLRQATMQQKHQMAMQQQQASAAVAAAATVGGRAAGAAAAAGLSPLVEVEVVEAGEEGADDDEQSVRRWGHPHEQQVHVVKVAVPQPVPVPVPQPVPVAVPHPVPVRVKVAEHIEVPVVRTVAVPVETPVPVKVEHLIPYPVEKPVPVPVEKHVPYPVHEPYPVKVPVVKTIHHYLKKVKKSKKKKKKGNHHSHHHHHQERRRRRHHPHPQRHQQERRRLRHRRRMRKMRRPHPSD